MVFRERVPDMRFYRGFCALQNHRYFVSIGCFFMFFDRNNIFVQRFPHLRFYGVFCALLKPRYLSSFGRFFALNP